jgi:hypothetical protein
MKEFTTSIPLVIAFLMVETTDIFVVVALDVAYERISRPSILSDTVTARSVFSIRIRTVDVEDDDTASESARPKTRPLSVCLTA